MATKINPAHLETLVLVMVSAGVGAGAGGWGITGSGKLKKIPSNNPFGKQLLAAAAAYAAQQR